MDERCARHQFELADGVCRACGELFCNECLVYSFGAKKPPFCVSCALAASGVRANGARPTKVSRKEMKRRLKLHEEIRRSRETHRVEVDDMAIDWSDDGFQPVPESSNGEVPVDRPVAS